MTSIQLPPGISPAMMAVPIGGWDAGFEPTYIPYAVPWTPPLAPGADIATTFTISPGDTPIITHPYGSPVPGIVATIVPPSTDSPTLGLTGGGVLGSPIIPGNILPPGSAPLGSVTPIVGGALLGARALPLIALKLWHLARGRAMAGMGGSALGGAALGPFGAVAGFGAALLGRGWFRTLLGTLGVVSLADYVLNTFGIDLGGGGPDEDDLSDMIEDIEGMVSAGEMQIASPRRGDTSGATPSIFVYDLSGNLNNGRPFLTWEYFSRNFVRAVQSREEKKGFRKTVRKKR